MLPEMEKITQLLLLKEQLFLMNVTHTHIQHTLLGAERLQLTNNINNNNTNTHGGGGDCDDIIITTNLSIQQQEITKYCG